MKINDIKKEIKDIKKSVEDQVVESEKLKKGIVESVNAFTRLEMFYKIKCKELELAEEKASKETAEKFAKLIEFHSISRRDENGYETFTISNLGLREILREEFDFTSEEIETIWEIKG